MNFKRVPLIFFSALMVSAFFVWLWAYRQDLEDLKRERIRGELLVQALGAKNAAPIENQLEPLISLNGIGQSPGVLEAVVTDSQGKILAPLNRFQETYSPAKIENAFVLESPILGLNKETVGRAVIVFKPSLPNFSSLWFIFLIPIFLAATVYYSYWQDDQKENAMLPPKVKDSYSWLSLLSTCLKGTLYVFDEEGKILASSNGKKPNHLLDLFPEASRAQAILTLVQQLKDKEESRPILSQFKKVQIGAWRSDDGSIRYLLAYC